MSASVQERNGKTAPKPARKRRRQIAAQEARLHDASIAIASDGTVLIALSQLVGSGDLNAVLERAKTEASVVFVGVPLDERELEQFVLPRLQRASTEAAAWVLGARRAKHKSKGSERQR